MDNIQLKLKKDRSVIIAISHVILAMVRVNLIVLAVLLGSYLIVLALNNAPLEHIIGLGKTNAILVTKDVHLAFFTRLHNV